MKTISVIKMEYLNLLEECNDIDIYQERAVKSFDGLRDSIIDDIKEFDKELKKIVAWEEKGREENFGKNWKIEKPWMAKNYHIPEYKQIVKVICYLMEKFEIEEDELK